MRWSEKISIQKLRDGDKDEFEKIYFDLFDVLYALCYQYTLNKEISEGIVQDSFLRLWEIKNELKEKSNIKNLLYTIAKNNCLNYLRSQQIVWKHLNHIKAREFSYASQLLHDDGDDFLEFEELLNIVSEAIEKLPEEQKQVFKMSRMEEMKYNEIAGKLNLSVKTIESRMSKALKFLRIELKDYLALIVLITNILK
ncbi:RNA polymerase sigma-70 factor [Maribellus comscasis]|uniref:RNA polymerase sigma-70 factor n=1 Tax=Maribellus comscasis TaxID=2681766 RepID=A0A6I6JWE3_9BACT|nr:RNA polymerase sigma-70 factor [Maribellus comscasis]QGY45418.1 RNA polymerase sigma-70 factor [Maribellus comscasis]